MCIRLCECYGVPRIEQSHLPHFGPLPSVRRLAVRMPTSVVFSRITRFFPQPAPRPLTDH